MDCSFVEADELCRLFRNKGISPEQAVRQVGIIAFHIWGANHWHDQRPNCWGTDLPRNGEGQELLCQYGSCSQESCWSNWFLRQPFLYLQYKEKSSAKQQLTVTAMAKLIFLRGFCLPRPCLLALIFPLPAFVHQTFLSPLTEALFSLYCSI